MFIKPEKVTEEVKNYLSTFKINTKDYDEFYDSCNNLQGKVMIDESSANCRMITEIEKSKQEIVN